MAREIPIATARRMLIEMLALKDATIIKDVPFGEKCGEFAQTRSVQMLAAHVDALNLLCEALAAFEAAVSALALSRPQDQPRARALQTRSAAMLRRNRALLSRM